MACEIPSAGPTKGKDKAPKTDNLKELVFRAAAEGRFKAGNKESVFFRSAGEDGFEHLLVVGLGDRKKINDETLRVAMAVAVKTLAREKITSATLCIDSIRKVTKTAEGAGRAMAEGALLGSYKYDELKSKKKEDAEAKNLNDLHFVVSDKVASKKFGVGVEVGKIMGECTNFARDLGNAPGNYLTPVIFAEKMQKAVKGLPIKYEAFDKKKIESLKMGCFLGVNRGSAEEPRFMVLEYKGGKN